MNAKGRNVGHCRSFSCGGNWGPNVRSLSARMRASISRSGRLLSITQRLHEALALIDVRVLDHFIVGGGQVPGCAEHGRL